MLREEDKKQVLEQLKAMKDPVQFLYFTQKLAGACQYCVETETLLKELSELSDQLSLKVFNFITDKAEVETYKIDKIPATVIQAKQDAGIRFYGIPSGYEFGAFLQAILMLSNSQTGLAVPLSGKLKALSSPVHIQVFVTPTCPYCTRAALTAYQFAMESPFVRTDVIEVTEFPHLAQKYHVMGVPKIVINETVEMEGALPEEVFFSNLEKAVPKSGNS